MKKIIFVILFFLILIPTFSFTQQLQWYLHYSTGNWSDLLFDIHFTNENYGWVGGYGYPSGRFLMTKDGGNTWLNVDDSLYNSEHIQSIYFIDTLEGWILTMSGKILKSTDGGYNWIETYKFRSASGVAGEVYFKNCLEGWAVGGDIYLTPPFISIEEGFIYHTIDGGYNWQLVNDDTTVLKNDICFSDSSHGLITGYHQQIYRTSDGGVTWILNDTLSNDYNFHACEFINDSTFVIVGSFSVTSFLTYPLFGKSTDYGRNWNFFVWQTSEVEYFSCVDFIDENKAWFGGSDGRLMYSNDCGQSFQIFNLGTISDIWDVQMINEEIGWSCAGENIFKYGIPTKILEHQAKVTDFYLSQNYPNPFNSNTKINFELFEISHISITIFNVLGEEVVKLMSENKLPGKHSTFWSGTDKNNQQVSTGIYIAQIKTKDSQQTIKMLNIQ